MSGAEAESELSLRCPQDTSRGGFSGALPEELQSPGSAWVGRWAPPPSSCRRSPSPWHEKPPGRLPSAVPGPRGSPAASAALCPPERGSRSLPSTQRVLWLRSPRHTPRQRDPAGAGGGPGPPHTRARTHVHTHRPSRPWAACMPWCLAETAPLHTLWGGCTHCGGGAAPLHTLWGGRTLAHTAGVGQEADSPEAKGQQLPPLWGPGAQSHLSLAPPWKKG